MPTETSYGTQASQIGKETTEAIAVAALKRLSGISFNISPDVTTDDLKRMGTRWPAKVTPGMVKSKFNGTGKPTYPDLSYIFSGTHHKITPTTPGGGTDSRLWTALQSSSDEDPVDSFTIEVGNRKLARRAAGCIFTGYTFGWDTQRCSLSAEGFGGKITTGLRLSTNEIQTIAKTGTVSSGTYAITNIVNPVTSETKSITGIAYNANLATLQGLFDALWGTGLFLVGGGNLPTTSFTVEFIGSFGQYNTALMVADSAGLVGGGTYDITTTTPGVAPTKLDVFDIQPNHLKIYSDTTYGGIGGTKLARLFSGSIAIGSMREALHVVDRDQAGAPVGHLESDSPTGEFKFRIMANEVADTHLADLYTGAIRYFRVEAQGDLIEGSLYYKAVWDLACSLRSVGEYGPEGKAYALDFNWGIIDDVSFGRAISAYVQNKVTAL